MRSLSRLLQRQALGSIAAVLLAIGPATAAVQTFSNATDFFNASASFDSTTMVDFASALGAGELVSDVSASGLVAGNAVFSGDQTRGGSYLFVVRPGYAGSNTNYTGWTGNPVVLQGPPGVDGLGIVAGSLHVALPQQTFAVGASFYTVSVGGNLRIALDGGTPLQFFTAGKPGVTFFGFVSDVAVSEIIISGVGDVFPNVANFAYAQSVVEVPEPEVAALLVAGLVMVAGVGPIRRRLRARTK